jgi:hypothetical protein
VNSVDAPDAPAGFEPASAGLQPATSPLGHGTVGLARLERA